MGIDRCEENLMIDILGCKIEAKNAFDCGGSRLSLFVIDKMAKEGIYHHSTWIFPNWPEHYKYITEFIEGKVTYNEQLRNRNRNGDLVNNSTDWYGCLLIGNKHNIFAYHIHK